MFWSGPALATSGVFCVSTVKLALATLAGGLPARSVTLAISTFAVPVVGLITLRTNVYELWPALPVMGVALTAGVPLKPEIAIVGTVGEGSESESVIVRLPA